jgi:signal transduction histidine kinase
VVIADDGVGLERAGSPSTEGGHGLTLHGTLMAVVGGSLAVESAPGQGTRVLLSLPE